MYLTFLPPICSFLFCHLQFYGRKIILRLYISRWLDLNFETVTHSECNRDDEANGPVDNKKVTITCEDGELSCKLTTLTENSPVFAAMFNGNFTEGQNMTAKIPTLKKSILSKVVMFLGNGLITLQAQDVLEFMELGNIYDIKSLRNACSTAMFKQMTPKIRLPMWSEAKRLNAEVLEYLCKYYCLKSFWKDNLHTSKAFLMCEKQIVVELLGDRNLYINYEWKVLAAIIRWVQYDEQNRIQDFLSICSTCVRVEHIPTFKKLSFVKGETSISSPDILNNLTHFLFETRISRPIPEKRSVGSSHEKVLCILRTTCSGEQKFTSFDIKCKHDKLIFTEDPGGLLLVHDHTDVKIVSYLPGKRRI